MKIVINIILFQFTFMVIFILSMTSCNKPNVIYKSILEIDKETKISIPYEFAFLENLSPNCDSALLFSLNNIVISESPPKVRTMMNAYADIVLDIPNISRMEEAYNTKYGIQGTDVSLYLNVNCIKSKNEMLLFFKSLEGVFDASFYPEVINFKNIWAAEIISGIPKNAFFVNVYTNSRVSHPYNYSSTSSISDAFLAKRTNDCDNGLIYSRRNIHPLMVKTKWKNTKFVRQNMKSTVFVKGIHPPNSTYGELSHAQLERLFIRLDCLVGMSSNEIFKLFCHPTQINDFKKWEKTYYFWNKTKILEIKFKDFPSKGIYVKLENGMVVDAGILE